MKGRETRGLEDYPISA